MLKIVLLGSLPKGDLARENFVDWKKEYVKLISERILNASFLHGDLVSDAVGPKMVVGHDLWQIKNADIIIVHAVSKIGAGTAQEMVFAKMFKKPVISILPKNSHHRKTNVIFDGHLLKDWIHPYLCLCSDYIVENIEDALLAIIQIQKGETSPKDLSIFDDAINGFPNELAPVYQEYKSKGW